LSGTSRPAGEVGASYVCAFTNRDRESQTLCLSPNTRPIETLDWELDGTRDLGGTVAYPLATLSIEALDGELGRTVPVERHTLSGCIIHTGPQSHTVVLVVATVDARAQRHSGGHCIHWASLRHRGDVCSRLEGELQVLNQTVTHSHRQEVLKLSGDAQVEEVRLGSGSNLQVSSLFAQQSLEIPDWFSTGRSAGEVCTKVKTQGTHFALRTLVSARLQGVVWAHVRSPCRSACSGRRAVQETGFATPVRTHHIAGLRTHDLRRTEVETGFIGHEVGTSEESLAVLSLGQREVSGRHVAGSEVTFDASEVRTECEEQRTHSGTRTLSQVSAIRRPTLGIGIETETSRWGAQA
jgi:hypothetical protein